MTLELAADRFEEQAIASGLAGSLPPGDAPVV
jgi:hypothetical protein